MIKTCALLVTLAAIGPQPQCIQKSPPTSSVVCRRPQDLIRVSAHTVDDNATAILPNVLPPEALDHVERAPATIANRLAVLRPLVFDSAGLRSHKTPQTHLVTEGVVWWLSRDVYSVAGDIATFTTSATAGIGLRTSTDMQTQDLRKSQSKQFGLIELPGRYYLIRNTY